MSDEHREPAKHHALQFGEQPVAPVERGLQGLLARRRRARARPQQRQALVEKRGGLLQAVGLDASGRQLDRERHAVELSADARDDARFRIAEVETGAARRRALHEQLGGRKRLDSRRRELRVVRRTGKRIQPVDVLALDPESLAARRQDVDLRRGLRRCLRPARRPLRRDARRYRGSAEFACRADRRSGSASHRRTDRQPQHGGDGRAPPVGIAQHAEIDEEHGAAKASIR